jgi:D-galactarolactone cycloisomerase
MSLRIARIETFLYRAEVKEPVKTSFGSIPRRSVLLLRVEDSEGAHGWGEVWCNFPPFSADNKMRLFETVIAPAALSGTYRNAADAWHTLTTNTSRWAFQGGEPGPFAACIAGLDLALWDMTARRAGKPLRALLAGGDVRNEVPAYASGLNPDTAPETVARCREAGFRAFKVKVAFGTEIDTDVISKLSAGLRSGELLMIDANQGWDLAEARRAVPHLGAFGLGFIEEPIPADRPAAEWAELAMLSLVPLAGGENVPGFDNFGALINNGHHGVVQPDMLKWGGVTGGNAVGRRAVASGRSNCPHSLTATQILAAAGGSGLLEHDVMENPLREILAQPFPRVEDGLLPLPMRPGLGVDPDLQAASGWLLAKAEYRA